MFDEILKTVKEHLGSNPQVASGIPADQADAIHSEIANHITNGLTSQNTYQGGCVPIHKCTRSFRLMSFNHFTEPWSSHPLGLYRFFRESPLISSNENSLYSPIGCYNRNQCR
jgi:hypothetical protein